MVTRKNCESIVIVMLFLACLAAICLWGRTTIGWSHGPLMVLLDGRGGIEYPFTYLAWEPEIVEDP